MSYYDVSTLNMLKRLQASTNLKQSKYVNQPAPEVMDALQLTMNMEQLLARSLNFTNSKEYTPY